MRVLFTGKFVPESPGVRDEAQANVSQRCEFLSFWCIALTIKSSQIRCAGTIDKFLFRGFFVVVFY